MKRIEALVDAIGKYKGMLDPESACYKLRNPMLIKSFALPGKHQIDENGYRVFPSLLNGYKACLFDLECKLSGRTRAKVTADSTLDQVLACYEVRTAAAIDYVASFLRRALNDTAISAKTPAAYFLEDAQAIVSEAANA